MTTSRRLALFERTIQTLHQHVHDLNRVDEVLHLDDSSPPADLMRMRNRLGELLAGAKLRSINVTHFPNAAHHACMMQQWHDLVSPADFVFHCEDDWEFIQGGNLISDAMAIMNANPAIGQVGLWRKPPAAGIKELESIRYWEWHHETSITFRHRSQQEDEIDPAWPHFSLRPSIVRCEALRRVGNFSIQRHFEHAYAIRWTELGWKTAFLATKHCFHQATGPGQSAYEMGGTLR